ncbi:MAG: substrate-binding domain-containing protein [Acidimicrobiia bacterium]
MNTLQFTNKTIILASIGALALGACGSSSEDSAGSGGAKAKSLVPGCLSFADLYALTSQEAEGVATWDAGQKLATELGSTTKLPKADFTLFGPGEESGTFNSYVEIALQKIGVDERGLEKDAVTTRPDYSSNADDNATIEGVAGTKNSLGWVGFAFADQNQDTLRLLKVSGGEGCVAPTKETIADNTYPLSRPLYIYVNNKNAKENAAVAAFVDTYVSTEGEASVSEADYVNLPAEDWAATQKSWNDLGIKASSGAKGSVVVTGSSTVEPISKIVAEKFSSANPEAQIDVTGPGTGDGFKQFCASGADITDASRPIKPEEEALCEAAGVTFTELKVGIDGISIVTKK